jgi:hypothetical protein
MPDQPNKACNSKTGIYRVEKISLILTKNVNSRYKKNYSYKEYLYIFVSKGGPILKVLLTRNPVITIRLIYNRKVITIII